MKSVKILGILFLTALLTFAFPNQVCAGLGKVLDTEPKEGEVGSLHWTISSAGELVITGSGALESDYYNRPPFSEEFFSSVTIGEGITAIGDYAFYENNNIVKITLPSTLERIGICAFAECGFLTDASLPKSGCVYDRSAFNGAPFADEGEGFVVIDGTLLNYYDNANFIKIPEGITAIGNEAFSGRSGLQEVTIPEGVRTIGDAAFSYCENLSQVEFPQTLESIGSMAFYDCLRLRQVVLPDSATNISEDSFDENTHVRMQAEIVRERIFMISVLVGTVLTTAAVVTALAIAISISRKRGDAGPLSSQTLRSHKVCRIFYVGTVAAVTILLYLYVLENHMVQLSLTEKEGFVPGLIGIILLAVCCPLWIGTEIIRRDFPWGLARLAVRLVRMIFLCTVLAIPLIIMLLFDRHVTLALVLLGVGAWNCILSLGSGGAPARPKTAEEIAAEKYEEKLNFWERVWTGGFTGEELYNYGMATKDTDIMLGGQMMKEEHSEKMEAFTKKQKNKEND